MAITPISGSNISSIVTHHGARAAASPVQQAPGGYRPDQVRLSAIGATARKAEAAAAEAPELRAERVAELKAQVAAGVYQVDSTALAHRLLSVL